MVESVSIQLTATISATFLHSVLAFMYISLSALLEWTIASLCLEVEKSTTSFRLSMFCNCMYAYNIVHDMDGVYPPVLRIKIDMHACARWEMGT